MNYCCVIVYCKDVYFVYMSLMLVHVVHLHQSEGKNKVICLQKLITVL